MPEPATIYLKANLKANWVPNAHAGEWKEGFMHGVGTFEGPNGSRYQGSWARDVKHGLCKQIFSNGDVYEVTKGQ